ncbi:MAG: hypothetical protein SOZ52_02470 [Pyramidobacter sp.]|nr:hypothetical protein [Pyramidobacter sp.]
MRILAFILAVFSAGYSMFQSGLGQILAEKGFEAGCFAGICALELGVQCILASAVLGVLGALLAVKKSGMASVFLIIALIVMIYAEIKAPFVNSWVCVLLYALAAMWAGAVKPEEESAAESAENAEQPDAIAEELEMAEECAEETVAQNADKCPLAEAEEAVEAAEAPADDVKAEECSEQAAVSCECGEPVCEELEAAEECAEETAELNAEECPLAEAEEAAEGEAAEVKTVVVKQEESPMGTVLVMLVAAIIGAGMMSAYWKNDAEQKAKAVRAADPVYQQMTEDIKTKDALILKHEEALKANAATMQEQEKLAAEKDLKVQSLTQQGEELNAQISSLKTVLNETKAESNELKEKVASLEKSIADQAAKKYAVIKGEQVRIRTAPSTAKDSKIIARLSYEILEVIKSERPRGASAPWYYVKGDFGEGWVFGKNIQLQR